MSSQELARAIIFDMIAEVNAGIIPRTVSSFSEVHGYLDANCLGPTEGRMEAGSDFMSELAFLNDAQWVVDAWLKSQPFLRGTNPAFPSSAPEIP